MKLSVEAFPKSPNILGSQKEDLLGCGNLSWNFHSSNILFSTRFAGIFLVGLFFNIRQSVCISRTLNVSLIFHHLYFYCYTLCCIGSYPGSTVES